MRGPVCAPTDNTIDVDLGGIRIVRPKDMSIVTVILPNGGRLYYRYRFLWRLVGSEWFVRGWVQLFPRLHDDGWVLGLFNALLYILLLPGEILIWAWFVVQVAIYLIFCAFAYGLAVVAVLVAISWLVKIFS